MIVNCPYCHAEVYPDSIRCPSCGRDLVVPRTAVCSICGQHKSQMVAINDVFYCEPDAIDQAEKLVTITTTPKLDGQRITRYLDVETAEIVIGSKGITNLQTARYAVLQLLKYTAFLRSATAVVGIDLDYTEFTGGRIILVATGTLVQTIPNSF